MNDNLSIEIRNKRISRDKAIKILQLQKNNLIPKKDIQVFCKFTKINYKEFFKICEKFRNKNIWKKKKKYWKLINDII